MTLIICYKIFLLGFELIGINHIFHYFLQFRKKYIYSCKFGCFLRGLNSESSFYHDTANHDKIIKVVTNVVQHVPNLKNYNTSLVSVHGDTSALIFPGVKLLVFTNMPPI